MVNNMKVLRGGSRYSNLSNLRCSCRYNHRPAFRYINVGFRLVGEMREKESKARVLRRGLWIDGNYLFPALFLLSASVFKERNIQ